RYGAAGLLIARKNIERVQPLHVGATFFAGRDDKDGSACEVDNGSSTDADFGMDVSRTGLNIGRWNRGCPGGRPVGRAEETGLPQGSTIRATIAIGIEGIDRVVLVR